MEIVIFLLIVAAVYLSAGFLFAVIFVLKGVDVIDEGAHGAGWGFRLIIIPGCTVFWPLLLSKWKQASTNNKKMT